MLSTACDGEGSEMTTKAMMTASKLLTHRAKEMLGTPDQRMLANMYINRTMSHPFFLIAADHGNFLRMSIPRAIQRSTIRNALSKGLDSSVAEEEGNQTFNGLVPV